MKAMTTLAYGDSAQLKLMDIDELVPGPGQVLVRVLASSVNPVDWKVRRGEVRLFSGWRRPPQVLGADFAGEIAAVGEEVSGYQPGDRVFGMLRAFRGGAYAQYLLAEVENVAAMPAGLRPIEAACLPLVGLTIWQLFEHKVRLAPGQRVLINGCCGGIGHIAVQWAKAQGLHVTGVCSAKNRELAVQLGADRVLDYRTVRVAELDEQFDLIFDAAATLSFASCRRQLTETGCFVSPIPSPRNMLWSPVANRFRRQHEHYLWVKPSHQGLLRIRELAEAGQLRPWIGRTLPLEALAEAHRISEAGQLVGKLAIEVN